MKKWHRKVDTLVALIKLAKELIRLVEAVLNAWNF